MYLIYNLISHGRAIKLKTYDLSDKESFLVIQTILKPNVTEARECNNRKPAMCVFSTKSVKYRYFLFKCVNKLNTDNRKVKFIKWTTFNANFANNL